MHVKIGMNIAVYNSYLSPREDDNNENIFSIVKYF